MATKKRPGVVYLLHFVTPVNSKRPARHYIGWTTSDKGAENRLQDHKSGRGARITAACAERGIEMILVRTWPGGRRLERKLKCVKNAPRFCPVCITGKAQSV